MLLRKRDVLFERIREWNKERNGLKYDRNLEVKLLTEEMAEILTAPNNAEILRECADFMFVAIGTMCKMKEAKVEDSMLGSWMYFNIEWMENRLWERGFSKLLQPALEIVCDANDKKPKDPTTGKVVKGPDYVDPINLIEELIDARFNR